MAIICRKYNLLFIMTPRTACTAIGQLLCEHYGGEFLPTDDILDSKGITVVQKKHCTLSELLEHKLLTAEEAKSMLKVAAVRNPFDSLVSFYFKQRLKYQPLLADSTSWVNRSPTYAENMNYAQQHSFNRWVLKVCYRKLIKSVLGGESSMFPGHTRGMNVVLRYENLQTDLKRAFAAVGIPWIADIPVVNRTEERDARDYPRYYSLLARLAVGRAFADDLKTYGYKF
jgi:hypothetical protein